MKLEIDLKHLISFNINPHQYLILQSLYYKDYRWVTQILTKEQCIKIRNELTFTDFLLSDNNILFTETIINKPLVEKLLKLDKEIINFSEWYQIYPVKVGSRILRAVSDESVLYKKHKEKYLKRVKKQEDHQKAINATEAFIANQKQSGKLQFLPNIQTVLNNSLWESWESYIIKTGTEGSTWNNTNI